MNISSVVFRIGAAIVCAASAAAALGDEVTSRALNERQQQSDAFSLQLQQSIQSFRAGPLSPQQRLELDSLQRDQRMRQDESFYRQDAQRRTTPDAAARRADALRLEQDRQMQLDDFAREQARALARPQPAAPNPQPRPAP